MEAARISGGLIWRGLPAYHIGVNMYRFRDKLVS